MTSGGPIGRSATPSIWNRTIFVSAPDIQIVVAPRDGAATKAGAEMLLLVEAAIAVGVAQRHHRASGRVVVVERHIQIAVGSDGDVTRRTEIVGHDGGAEAGGQRESAVVRIAGTRPG